MKMLDEEMWRDTTPLGLLAAYREGEDIIYHGFPEFYLNEPSSVVRAPWSLTTVRDLKAIREIDELRVELGHIHMLPSRAKARWLAVVLRDHLQERTSAFLAGYSWPLDSRLAWVELLWIAPSMRSGKGDYALIGATCHRFFWELAHEGYVGAVGEISWTEPHYQYLMRSSPFRCVEHVLIEHGLVS